MKLNKKKGFTIVELVIVIAVIAILAAVLIPNISKLVKKANASADESLVRNLNTALAMDTEKHATMSDALKAALDNGGYDVAKIVTKDKDNKILWDSVNDCFVYLKKGDEKPTYIPKTSGKYTEAKDYQLFEIVDEIPDLHKQTYSLYLSGTDYNKIVEVVVGFDAGLNTKIPLVKYERTSSSEEQTVVIYTSSFDTNLYINASTDTISHYGEVGEVEGKAVHTASFYEYGQYKFRDESVGHFVDKAEQKNGAIRYISAITATYDVSNGVTPTVAYVASNISVADLKGNGNGQENLKIDSTNSKDAIKKGAMLFAGGIGTKDDPYIIESLEQWYNFKNSKLTSGGLYWSVQTDLDFFNANQNVDIEVFSGVIDFNNNTIIANGAVFSKYKQFLFDSVNQGSVIRNLKFVVSGEHQLVYTVTGINSATKALDNNTILLENITALGNLVTSDNNCTPFVWDVEGNNTELKFLNCINRATIISTAKNSSSAFLGKVYDQNNYTGIKVVFENCQNYATILQPNGYASMLIANSASLVNLAPDAVSVINCKNYGSVLAKTSTDLLCGGKWGNGSSYFEKSKTLSENGNLVNAETGVCKTVNINSIGTSDGYFTFESNNQAVTYTLSFSFWVVGYKNNEKDTWGSAGLSVNVTAEELEALKLPVYQWTTDTSNATKVEFGDGYYYTNGTQYVLKDIVNYVNCDRLEMTKVTLSLIGYDSNGNIVSYSNYQYN